MMLLELTSKDAVFFKCTANDAACIGITSGSNSKISLDVRGSGDIETTFQNIIGIANNYAVVADVNILNIDKCTFDKISVGGIKQCRDAKN